MRIAAGNAVAFLHCKRDVSEPSARGGRSTWSYRRPSSSYFARANANRGIGFVDHLTHCQKTVDLALEANVRDAVSRFAEALGIDEAIVTQWIIAGGRARKRAVASSDRRKEAGIFAQWKYKSGIGDIVVMKVVVAIACE